ncbi:unnamed protein product [Leptosia nina]|uniref:Uncharacterized protein n=1 Tax=Leptosia nina TaxID=320188 RepID=A0AAV1JHK8_9NEOP
MSFKDANVFIGTRVPPLNWFHYWERQPTAPTGTMKVRQECAGRGRVAAGAGSCPFPVPRRGMPARATKPTGRHLPRSAATRFRLALIILHNPPPW